jgi:hypothetical protein
LRKAFTNFKWSSPLFVQRQQGVEKRNVHPSTSSRRRHSSLARRWQGKRDASIVTILLNCLVNPRIAQILEEPDISCKYF